MAEETITTEQLTVTNLITVSLSQEIHFVCYNARYELKPSNGMK